ncbi:MAG TPA: PDZ domain-containing protein [Flavitalea sp.]|nr:PDZ domain-containing protein [Flavitalea sp.]
MKKLLLSAVAVLSLISYSAVAQDREEKRKSKTRSSSDDNEEIIIRPKEGKDARVVIEIRDNEILVNGKPIDDYDDDDVTVSRRKTSTYNLIAPSSPFRANGGLWKTDDNKTFYTEDNKAFLGVSTEEDEDGGAKILSVTDESAAEKAGLEKGDVITAVNDMEIDKPSDLTEAISKLKPEQKVTITYKRDGRSRKLTATLGKRKGMTFGNGFNFQPKIDVMPDLDVKPFEAMPKMDYNFKGDFGDVFAYAGKGRLGIRAQDTEDGKGVKVIDVDEGSAADKAGVKKDDIITEFDGESVNSADELAEAAREANDKSSLKIVVDRDGRERTLELKIAKRLKSSNL